MKIDNFREKGIFVGDNSRFFGPIDIEKEVQIWQHCMVGFSGKEEGFTFKHSKKEGDDITFIGQGTTVKQFSMIFRGAKIGREVEIYEYTRIGLRTQIGDKTKIVYSAKIYDDVVIGKKCIIAGFCCNGSKIGGNTTMLGHLVHKYPEHAIDFWDNEELEDPPSPIIEENVIIGYNSIIIGDVTIGRNSYIAAGAIITRDVPPDTKIITSRVLNKYKR